MAGRGLRQQTTRPPITAAFVEELSEAEDRRKNFRREGPKCSACGSFEDLKGHVDVSKSSEIFYLCSKCCEALHGH